MSTEEKSVSSTQQEARVNRAAAEPELKFVYSPVLVDWLEAMGVGFGFSTYQIGKVFLVGRQPNIKRLSLYERTFEQAMGIASSADGEQLVLGTAYQVWRFTNAVRGHAQNVEYDKVYIPHVGYTTANCDIHDVGVDQEGNLIFVNTLFNCVAKVSDRENFKRIWKPPFISDLVPEDRCHLNGLAFREGEPRYVTGFSQTDSKEGWREVGARQSGGFVMDIQTNEVLCEGLSMPHSPRWHQGKIWLLNSGAGEFGYVDSNAKTFKPISFCPGYARGLGLYGDFALIGLSKLRQSGLLKDSVLQRQLKEKEMVPRCGLLLVDLRTAGSILAFTFDGVIEEIYDVTIIPKVKRPMLLGFRNDEIRRFYSFSEEALNTPKENSVKALTQPPQEVDPKQEEEKRVLDQKELKDKDIATSSDSVEEGKSESKRKDLVCDKSKQKKCLPSKSMAQPSFWQQYKQPILFGLSSITACVAVAGLTVGLKTMTTNTEEEHNDILGASMKI